MKKLLLIPGLLIFYWVTVNAQEKIIPGAERVDVYIPMLKGKRVAVFANQTSMVGNTNLVDTLVKRGINVVKIFGPEHGFRGTADAGKKVGDYVDAQTGIPVISLFGPKRRPSDDDLEDVDIMIFDIQDVGVRFYTYISSLEEYMDAAFENSKPLLVLDRPNPNGFYVDGPVLDTKFKSFVGMQPVPIVYGLTIGEYAMMISGEKWLTEKANQKQEYYAHAKNSKDTPFHFLVIKCKNYNHTSKYILPIKPSPNLPDIQSVYCYPSTCFFEATFLSEGRGTPEPFQYFGHPSLSKNLFSFTPRSMEGATNPKFKDTLCFGWNLSGNPGNVLQQIDNRIQLKWILQAYKMFPDKSKFFRSATSLNRLAGNDVLEKQITAGLSEEAIRKTWEPALRNYKTIRKKYLMYKDF